MFGSFLPSLRSSINHSLLGSRSRHCYAIKWNSIDKHMRVSRYLSGETFHKRTSGPLWRIKIEVKFLLFTSNRNRARLLYVTHRRASSGKQDGNPSRHARPDGPASAAGHGPVA